MEKRILLAFALSMLVLVAFRLLSPPEPTPPAASPTQNSAVATPEAPKPEATSSLAPPSSAPSEAEIRADGPKEELVENDLYIATVSNVGGVVTSFKLKDGYLEKGEPLELIGREISEKVGWPMAIETGDALIDAVLDKAPFTIRREGARVSLEFSGSGIHAQKTFEFESDNYAMKVKTELSKGGVAVSHRVVWQGAFGDQSIPPDPIQENAVVDVAGKFDRIALAKAAGQERASQKAGIEDQYFLAMFLAPAPATFHFGRDEFIRPAVIEAAPAVQNPPPDGKPATDNAAPPAEGQKIERITVAAPMSPEGLRVYVGPKEKKALAQVDPHLVEIPYFGFFSFVTKPLTAILLGALLWIHGFVGNFGWAIVVLTCAINAIMLPLRLKQQASMMKMQKIQPQMRTIQDKMKKLKTGDPRKQELQNEMMGLYSEHGVNPLGGCLPLLLQLPFLWAFWSMLSISIELRRAPWMLWIHDLSQKDPYYILPILMAASMIIMQKMTPTAVDSAQATMLMFMPVIFGFMFRNYQSGLTLYWLTSNVVGVIQQYVIMKYWSGNDSGKDAGKTVKKKLPSEAS